MSGPEPIEVFRERLKGFLLFLKPKLLAAGADLDRLAQLRRLSDVRIRQFSVGKPRVTATDLAALLADPNVGRFDALAQEAGLARPGHFALPLPALGEETGYLVETALTLQVVGAEMVRALLKDFVARQGPLKDAPGSAPLPAAAPAAARPLPAAVANLLGSQKQLWAVSSHAARILELLQSADRPPDPACAEIERDPPLAARCLRVANAMGAALGTKTTSVKRAVVSLGYPATRRVVSVAALLTAIGAPPAGAGFDPKTFWSHSLWVAHAAGLAARAVKAGSMEENFAAGLVHDVGRLVQARFLAAASKPPSEPAGTTHAEIGACVLERWRFPASAVEAARHHLDPRDRLEEAEIPREAMTVAALCGFSRNPADGEAWTGVLRLPLNRVQEIRYEADKLAAGSLGELLG